MDDLKKAAEENPKEVYDLFRLSLLNAKYYAYQVKMMTRINLTFEIAIAVGATSSGVAGLAFFHTTYGEAVWAPLAATSAILATVKPVLDFGARLQKATELWAGYQSNFISLKRLVGDIRSSEEYRGDHRARFEANYDRHEKLSSSDIVSPSRKVLVQFQREVVDAFPSKSFWWPKPTD